MIKKLDIVKRLYQVFQDAFSGMQIRHHVWILPKVLISPKLIIDMGALKVIWVNI